MNIGKNNSSYGINRIVNSFGPRISFNPPNDDGSATPEELAEAEAAAKLIMEKAAKDKAEKEAKDKLNQNNVDDEKAKLLKEVMSKKKKLEETETKLGELEAQLKNFDGIDPKLVKELIEANKKAEEEKLKKEGDFESLKKMMADDFERKAKALEKSVEDSKKNFDALESEKLKALKKIEDLTIGHSFLSSKFISDELVLTPRAARAMFGSHFEVDENGDIAAYDKPAYDTTRNKLINSSGENMTFDEAIRALVSNDPEKDQLIKSKLPNGTGGNTDNNSKNARDNVSIGTGVERIKLAIPTAFGNKTTKK